MKSLGLFLTLLFSVHFSSAQNYVLDFDGDDHVLIDSNFQFANLTQLTYSMWVKSDWQGANYLVDITDDPAGYADPNGGWRTFIGRFNGNFIFSQYFRGENTSNVLDIDEKAGEYAHVACVIIRTAVNGNDFSYDMITYVNGVEQDRDEWVVRANSAADAYLRLNRGGRKVLGARFNLRNNNFLTGQMDDFAVYDVALSASEIKDIACAGATPLNNRTILFYGFNEGSGFSSVDSSGNAYNGFNDQPFFQRATLPDLSAATVSADFASNSFNQSYFARFQNLSQNGDLNIWDFGDGTIDTNNNNVLFHRFPSSDTFQVCLDASAACGGSDQYCSEVIINCPFPTANFNYIYQDLSFAGEADTSNVDSVFWDFGDGNFSNSPTTLHSFRFDGKKTICLYVYNNCGVDTICQTFDAVFSSSDERETSDELTAKSLGNKELLLSNLSNEEDMEYRLTDMNGKLIRSGHLLGEKNYRFKLNTKGIYLIELRTASRFRAEKVMVY